MSICFLIFTDELTSPLRDTYKFYVYLRFYSARNKIICFKLTFVKCFDGSKNPCYYIPIQICYMYLLKVGFDIYSWKRWIEMREKWFLKWSMFVFHGIFSIFLKRSFLANSGISKETKSQGKPGACYNTSFLCII